MVIFGPKPWVNLYGKMAIFRLFEFFFYSLEKRFFVLKYRKERCFPGLYCLTKRSWKNDDFCTKTMG